MTISTTLTVPPTVPSRDDPANFASEGDAFLAWMETFGTDLPTWTNETNQTQIEINAAKVAAESARDIAISQSPATAYNASTSYSQYDSVFGSNGQVYRFIGASPATGDDPVTSVTGNWVRVSDSLKWKKVTANYTAAIGDRLLCDMSGAPWTLTFPANPRTGDFVRVKVGIDVVTNNLLLNGNGNTIQDSGSSIGDGPLEVEFVFDGIEWVWN